MEGREVLHVGHLFNTHFVSLVPRTEDRRPVPGSATQDPAQLRGRGLQPGEVVLPEDDQQHAGGQPEVVIDEATVTRLKEMGFTRDRCRQAVYNTGNNGVEDPMAWVIDHMANPDFSDPVVDGGGSDPGHNQQSPAPSPKPRLENQ